jgi:beta-phosphoglucomutase
MHASTEPLRYDRVIFDVGGTLVGFHEWEPFQPFLAQAGLPATNDDTRAFHRRLLQAIVERRDEVQGRGTHDTELAAWWRQVYQQTWPDRPDLAQAMYNWMQAGRFDRVFSDAKPALEALRELGLPLAVLSNFTTGLEKLLERLDLRRYFDFLIVSAVVGLAKPDGRIFDLAVDQAGRPRRRLLYVGDHVGDDIEGARGAGLDAVLIDRRDRHAEAHCPRIGSLLELVPYVQVPVNPARAVILDMDGVVLDSMPTHLRTWQQSLAPLGIDLTADDLYPLEGVPTERTAQRLTERVLGQACSTEEARRLAETKRALFRQQFEPKTVHGIVPLLYDLRDRGFSLGLVTGSARSVVDESLVPTGLADLFDVVVTGDQVSQGKPDPEPYRLAAEGLGLPPADCLVVENAPLGIRSATEAGMQCVALETTLPAARLARADQAFSDAQALRSWLLARWAQGQARPAAPQRA